MDDYIIEHNKLYKRVENFDICKLGSGAKGFLLLERAKLTFKEEQLDLTGVKFEESDSALARGARLVTDKVTFTYKASTFQYFIV